VFDLEQELAAIVDALTNAAVPYALCGGLALAVHGAPRATVDIDLLVRQEDVERIHEAVGVLGFTFRARPMQFAGGAVSIARISKIDTSDGETLMLDLLLVTHDLEPIWDEREAFQWNGRALSVVSRAGLIALKKIRSSAQDLADIERLHDLA
jgi:hypothetical protein